MYMHPLRITVPQYLRCFQWLQLGADNGRKLFLYLIKEIGNDYSKDISKHITGKNHRSKERNNCGVTGYMIIYFTYI